MSEKKYWTIVAILIMTGFACGWVINGWLQIVGLLVYWMANDDGGACSWYFGKGPAGFVIIGLALANIIYGMAHYDVDWKGICDTVEMLKLMGIAAVKWAFVGI